MKRNFKAFALAVAMMLGLAGCAGNTPNETTAVTTSQAEITTAEETAALQTTAETTTAESEEITGGFRVEGTKLIDALGNEFILRGVNEAHSWYNTQDGVSLKAISELGCNCVRIVCGSGKTYTADTVITLQTLIRVCKNLNMVVILEAHDGTGSDSVDDLSQIADYWISVKEALIGEEAYVILNIANEWFGSWSNTQKWAQGYETVIPRLREAGIKNTIMVDAAGWGQYAKCIADYGKEVFESDPDKNTMFSVHMYGSAGKNESTIKSAIEGATNQNLCIVVGEFGYKHSDGDVNEAYIMEYCTQQGIGYMGWSWKGNGGGVEYLDLSDTWDGSKLSADWGEVLFNGENGIKATSKLCSVFN